MDTKKYIIEIPDNTAWLQWVKVSDKDGHVCFDFKDPEDLTLYTEPDLDAVRNEAIEKIRQYEDEQKEQKQEKFLTVEDVMRQYLDTFCKNRICSDCPLYTPEFTCGRGNHFCTNHPVSDEEVRRAYAKVLKNMKGE